MVDTPVPQPFWTQPVTLAGQHVRLAPLEPAHADGLRAAVRDGELWKRWYTVVPRPEDVDAYIATALAGQRAGTDLPFTVFDAAGDIVGCTRYCRIEQANHRLEIGYTWYAARVQRTPLNSEAKRLLLGHAFDTLGAIAVEFRTHWHNRQSRAAIERLGARLDGVLRNHRRLPDGSLRDTVVYSITDREWPAVRSGLRSRLARS